MTGLARDCLVLLYVVVFCLELCCTLADKEDSGYPGHVSKTDRKYLTKGGYYRGARHWWPFDYETKLRDIKYSRDGRRRGTAGVSISGKPRGYLSIHGNGWVRLGKFLKECVCDVRYCSKSGISVGLWIKLSRFDNETKIILGSDTVVLSNTTGFAIFQTTRTINESKARFVSALVFLENHKWKCSFAVEPGNWFYLTVTWSNDSGLRMFKDGELMSEQKRPKLKPRVVRHSASEKCAVSLSPPSARGPLTADYDDLVIWNYELQRKLMYQVYGKAIDPPKIIDCKTLDGKSADVYINDNDHIYDIKGDYKISWKRRESDESGANFTKEVSFRIKGLARSLEYIVEVRRRVFVSTGQTLQPVLSKPSKFTCYTRLYVPKRPKNFTVRERAETYFMLRWQQPSKVYGSILGYKISYRVDDFSNSKWRDTSLANVNRTSLKNLKPFTDYIIKLSCENKRGSGKAVIIRATTAVGVPTPPRKLRVKLKGEILVIKWREPEEMRGLVKYRLFALVNGTKKTICDDCDESYQLEDVHQYTTYKFWIIAYNINKDPKFVSKPSGEVTITTPSYTPSSPQNLTTNFTKSGIHVRWNKPSRPRGTIEYKLFGLVNGSRHVFCDECGMHYLITDVARFTLYTLSVLAYNVHKAYESLPTLKVTIDTGLYVPTTPRALTVNLSLQGIFISWNKSRVQLGSIRYQLMGNENGVKKIFCADCELKFLINKTEPNMNYSFWVVAQNVESGFKSVPSSVVHFHTTSVKPSPPEHILAPEVKDSSARITWDPPRGMVEGDEIVGYKVTLYDAFEVLDVTTTESLELEYNNLTQFSKYYVTVQVLSRAGYGPPSQQLTIQTKDQDECSLNDVPCNEHAKCINSAGSYFCTCLSGYVGDGNICEALPSEATEADFCPGETARNVTWQETYHGHTNKNLCPNGTIGISTRECLKGNGSRSYWSAPNLSNCVSSWITAVDDKLADRSLNSSAVGNFFLNLLDQNDERGLYGGDVIKSVNMIDLLYNKSIYNELDEQKSKPRIAEAFVTNLINITEKIISPENIKVWNDIPKGRRTEHSVRMMESLDNAALKSAKLVNFSSIRNEYIDVRYGRVSSFKLRKNKSSSARHLDEMESIKFPQQEKENSVEERTVAVIKYNTIAEVLSAGNQELKDEDVVNSAVLSITMNPPLSTPFEKPLEFKLNNQKNGKFDKHKCAFFNTSRYPGFWSTTGCDVFNVTDNFTVCHCNHMTSFSVLMQVKPAELSYSDELILGWVTRVGLCVSLVALGLAFLTFVFLPRPCGHRSGSRCFKLCEQGYRPTYLKKVRTSIHANLILSLALGEALFLWGIEKTENETTCYTVAVALHYLFLVAFHWMAAEGVILYLVLVKVFQRKSANKDKRMFMIICWGTPAAIVCIALVVGHEYYLHEQCCWLSVTHGMVWAFVGPALTIILVNVFFLCCTFRVMGRRHAWDKTEKKMADKIRYWAKGAGIVTCLLGVTWVFGVFFLNSNSVIVAYVFTFCNVFQGLFIFVFHCLLDEKIRQQYYQVLCAVAQIESRSRSPSHSTGTGKKEQRRSTFNSLLQWSVSPMKLQDSKSESCPTVAENTLKRLNSSTHSLTPAIDRRLVEIKRDSDTRPRGMSSIYHDSDENMDNIPDNILTVKHGSKNNSGRLDGQDENTTGSVFEEYWTSTLSRKNSQEFHEVPQATCEDCLYEMREWEEIQEILNKTKSFHEQVQLKTLKESCSSLEHKNLNEDLKEETNTNDVNSCQQDNMRDKENEHGLLTGEGEQCTSYTSEGKQCTSYTGEGEQCTSYIGEGEQCISYTSTVPHIIVTPDVSKCKRVTTPKCYQMVKVTDSYGVEISSGRKLSCPTSV